MPTYEYCCDDCNKIVEIVHSIKSEEKHFCDCGKEMYKKISVPIVFIKNGTLENIKEEDHKKRTKDPERARRKRKKLFGSDAVGDPATENNPLHVIKRGKVLAGQQKDIDKGEFIKSAAKDAGLVQAAADALKKKKETGK